MSDLYESTRLKTFHPTILVVPTLHNVHITNEVASWYQVMVKDNGSIAGKALLKLGN